MFQSINPKELNANFISLLDDRWALLGAKGGESCNAMTVSWGGVGVLFHKPVATIYVRPQRYTYELIEQSPEFTLSFLPEGHRKALTLFGSKSGRDMDKIKESGLTLAMATETAPYFEEAELALVCRKLYLQDFDPKGFLDPAIHEFYPERDYHRMYIGEITQVLQKS